VDEHPTVEFWAIEYDEASQNAFFADWGSDWR
jgi:hypothetical protein